MPKNRTPNTPEGLGPVGRSFWKKKHQEHEFEMTESLSLLRQACECLDTMVDARSIYLEAGLVWTDHRENLREHPSVKTERDMKILFLKIMKALGLPDEKEK